MNKLTISTLLLTSLFFCKGTDPEGKTLSALSKILSENQKINEALLSNPDKVPSSTELNKLLTVEMNSDKNEAIKPYLQKMSGHAIKMSSSAKKEEFFQAFSEFSEALAETIAKTGVAEYNRFFCPMVSKTWVAKGEKVNNPYAPEMRDCGEVVK